MSKEVIIYNSIKNFLEEWYKPETMKLLHWTSINPSNEMFHLKSDCECCSGSHYVECLYQTTDGIYIIKRMGFNTTNPKVVYPSYDEFIEPIKHPYTGHHEFKDFFYHQYIESLTSSLNSSRDNSTNNSKNNSRGNSRRNSRRRNNPFIVANNDFFGPSSI